MRAQVKLAILFYFFAQQVLTGVSYLLGGKAKTLDAGPGDTKRIDCSGEVRLLLYKASDGKIKLPDGSWNQREYCENNWEEVSYDTVLNAKKGELFISFITAGVKGAGKIGHVWLTAQMDDDVAAETMESYGGHGVGSRRADYGTLRRLVHKSFRVPVDATPEKVADVAVKEDALLVWNGTPFPVIFDDNGRPYIRLAELLQKGKQIVVVTTDRMDQHPPRYYLKSAPVPPPIST